jgi:hypothetical protein
MPWAPQVQPQAGVQARARAQPQARVLLEPAQRRSPLRATDLHRGTTP